MGLRGLSRHCLEPKVRPRGAKFGLELSPREVTQAARSHLWPVRLTACDRDTALHIHV